MPGVPSPFTEQQAGLLRAAGAASVAVALTLIGLKVWAWRLTDSVALLGSLADSLLDLIASLVTFFAVRVALTPADREHRFGHGKSEAIAGFAQGLIVTGSAVYVGVRAVLRLIQPAAVTEPDVGIAVTLVSLALTVALATFQGFVIRRTRSLAISADAVHYRADVLASVAVLAALYLSSQFGWYAADPLFGLLIVALILASVRKIMLDALDVLLDRELDIPLRQQIAELAAAHPHVRGVHDIRTRSAGATQFIQLHLELDPGLTLKEAHEISSEVERKVLEGLPRAEVLIHTDPFGYPDARDQF